jgi:hypothetical protein
VGAEDSTALSNALEQLKCVIRPFSRFDRLSMTGLCIPKHALRILIVFLAYSGSDAPCKILASDSGLPTQSGCARLLCWF